MELANIEKLVEKYLDAATSLQEEQTLKHYFTNGNVAPHLQEYSSLFNYFKISKQEMFTKSITLETNTPKKRNLKWLTVAASFALLVSVFVGQQEYEKYQQRKTYAQVEKVLKLLSINLKKGDKAFKTLYTYENTVNKINTILEPSK
jgi:hypothetical protein